ncbi:MAG TPA: glycosyltransferase [Segetibacter sp.]
MKIAGVVILYNPDEAAVIRNIECYIHFLDSLIVFDNSGCAAEFIKRVKELSNKIIFISNPQNEGIAKPLNKALDLVAEKYNWLLTMDQDSYFEEKQGEEYFSGFEQLFYYSLNIAIVCPNHSLPGESVIADRNYKEVIRAITSGSIINTKICRKLKGFDEKLFIDDVDLEYCYRCVLAGYKIIQFFNIYMKHELGTKKQAGYFNFLKKSNRSLHSPLRIYFIVRNFLYVLSKYQKLLPEEMKERKKGLLVILKNNLFFSGRFFQVLIAIIRGYLHFKLNKFSS